MTEPTLDEPVLVELWKPVLPPGELRSIVLHWTAGDYQTTYAAYHLCLTGATRIRVHATHDLRANMRAIAPGSDARYAAHTAGRNSFAAGVAVCGMRDATPHDFGACPLTAEQIEALCVVAAGLIRRYDIAIGAVRTHAEAALDDGYFGAGGDDVRWDLGRLVPAPHALAPQDAVAAGDRLRARIRALC